MLKERPLIKYFFLTQWADALITSVALASARATELNPLGFSEMQFMVKMAATSSLILLYALAKDKKLTWQTPLEHGMQLGTLVMMLALVSNVLVVGATL